MSEHRATVSWRRETDAFTYAAYNRAHHWHFEGGVVVPASATPAYKGDADRVDPEKAFVASLASCHMLTFLAYAAAKKFIVDSYDDEAVGTVAKNAAGKMWVSEVRLRPKIVFSGAVLPSPGDLDSLHHKAHEDCFIANSVKTEVVVEPR